MEIKTMPHMDDASLEIFTFLMKQTKCYLEYGTGASSIYASTFPLQKIYAVESDIKFLTSVSSIISSNNTDCQFLPFYVDIGPTKEWGYPINDKYVKNFPNYSFGVWDYADSTSVDLVLIDGRFRIACFLASLINLTEGSTILFDDYINRSYYHEVETVVEPLSIHGRMAKFLVPKKLNYQKICSLPFKQILNPL